MKITLIYLFFCIVLLYIYWYYTKLGHVEKCKQTKLAENYFSKENDNYLMIQDLQKTIVSKSVIDVKKAKKAPIKKKKK